MEEKKFEGKSKIIVDIDGIHCADCALNIERSAEHLPGVLSAKVSYVLSSATVYYDPHRVEEENIKKAITKPGYVVRETLAQRTHQVLDSREDQLSINILAWRGGEDYINDRLSRYAGESRIAWEGGSREDGVTVTGRKAQAHMIPYPGRIVDKINQNVFSQLSTSIRKTDAGGRSFKPFTRQAAVNYDGTVVGVGDNYYSYPQMWELNPATAAAWTTSEINTDAEFGIKDEA